MAAYNFTLLIWLGYAFAKSPVRDAPATLLRSQRWEQSLNDLNTSHSVPADSLIPMFEGMVDRALSRTQGSGQWSYDNAPAIRAAAARASASGADFPALSNPDPNQK
jgi:hypothetical protein